MKKLLLLICFAPILAWAQGSSPVQNAIALDGQGRPLPGVTVAICTSLPNSTFGCGGSSLVQTSTTVTLGVNCALSPITPGPLNGTGCTNPGTTDGFGNVLAYATSGAYWCQFQGSHIVGVQIYPCGFPNYGSFVTSVFGRSGAVVAQTGDYTCLQVTNCPPINGTNTWTGSNSFGSGLLSAASPTFTGTPVIPSGTQPVGILTGGVAGQCAVNVAGVWQAASCAGTAGTQVLSTDTTSTTVSANVNTVQNLKSYTFGAGVLNSAGKTVEFILHGIVTPNGQPETYRLGMNVGAFGNANYMNETISANGGRDWEARITCTVVTAGATGTLFCIEKSSVGQNGAVSGITDPFLTSGNAGGSVNFTGALSFQFTTTFSVASASNTNTQDYLVVSQLQ